MVDIQQWVTVVLVEGEGETWHTWAGSFGDSDEISDFFGALDSLESVVSEDRQILVLQIEQVDEGVVIIHLFSFSKSDFQVLMQIHLQT